MLAGHYAASFAAKGAEPRAPWWMLLLAAQLVDVLWAMFVFGGIERASLDFTLPSNALVAESMPYTHSLVGSAVWAALAGLMVWKWKGSARIAAAVALVVVSHWLLDLFVHRPDLTIAGGDAKLGMQLWNHPVLAQVFELGLLLLSYAGYRRWAQPSPAADRAARILLVVLFLVQLYAIFAPPPATILQMAGSLLVLWLALCGLGAWLEARVHDEAR